MVLGIYTDRNSHEESLSAEDEDCNQISNLDSLPPPPRRKSVATLITLPADEQIPPSTGDTSRAFSKTHSRTNTFGTALPNESGLPTDPHSETITEESEPALRGRISSYQSASGPDFWSF
ncbi:hypothetical protein B0H34DRAFT_715451 [Crassisporium funariophilum]|nr:hypothetical protein B0H34DRAFT_715451 [Crassisporium funariophilum]